MPALLIALAIGGLLAWTLIELALIRWRRAGSAHWTERARLLFPVRSSTRLNTWLIPAIITACGRIFWPEISWVCLVFGGVAGTTLGNYALDRAVIPQLAFRSWLHLVGAEWVMRFVRWGPFLAAAFFMPPNFGGRTTVVVGAFLAVQLAVQFGLHLAILRWVRLLHPASLRLSSLVADTCSEFGGTVRASWELAIPQANAIAFVNTRELVFTTKLLEIAPDDELRAICRHELAHLAEAGWVLIGRLFGSLALLPLIFLRPAYATLGESGIPLLLLLALVIWWGRVPLSRAMEKRADRLATEADAHAEPVYARALERIYRYNQMPAVMSKNSLQSHPDLYDRMVHAHLTPDYPRPQPPSTQAWSSTVLIALCVCLAIILEMSNA